MRLYAEFRRGVEFDYSSRATLFDVVYPSGCDDVWEWKPVFPRKILLDIPHLFRTGEGNKNVAG